MEKKPQFQIIDYADDPDYKEKVPKTPEKLPDSFGYNLDTVEKARQWLENPNNWFKSELFVLKWDGLLPRVSQTRGQRLVDQPWDDGLPTVVVFEQKRRRTRKDSGQSLDEQENPRDGSEDNSLPGDSA